MTIEIACPFCGRTTGIEVKEEDYVRWQMGALAQEAFPYLSPSEREVLISGMCFRCQDSIFGADDEDPEDEHEGEAGWDALDDPSWDDEYDDCDYEVGFDPYCGCYTDDC